MRIVFLLFVMLIVGCTSPSIIVTQKGKCIEKSNGKAYFEIKYYYAYKISYKHGYLLDNKRYIVGKYYMLTEELK